MSHMRQTLAAAACAGLILSPTAAPAQSAWFDLTVPGSLEEMLGTADRSLAGPRLMRSLIGAFHDPTGTIFNPAQAAGAFRACLGDVQRLQDGWRAVARTAGAVSLPAAASAAGGRRALEQFLDVFDLRLAGGGASPRVTPNPTEARRRAEATTGQDEPAVCGAGGGWTAVEIERRLNAGETIAWDVPHFEVSLPLSPQMWLQVVYGNASGPAATERAADLVGRLVTDPRAARFYTGLAALDDPTLAWLATNPRVLSRLAAEHLTAFAQYGGGLRVRDGAVRVTGGATADAFLEAMVGAPVNEPERFVDRLFSSERVAAAFDLMSRLPEPSRRFVTGAGQPDSRDWRRGLSLLGRVIETLPLPDPRFAERRNARDPSLVFTPRPGLRSGDRLNENICNLPDDEAVVLTWFNLDASVPAEFGGQKGVSGWWTACGPFQCTTGHANEANAIERTIGNGVPEHHCQIETRIRLDPAGEPLSDFGGELLPARLHRLHYPLSGALDDPRRFIAR